MTDCQDETATCDPGQPSKRKRLLVRLRDNWFFLKQSIRMAWWPNKIKQLDRERKDWQRWCREAERRCIELVATIESNEDLLESAWGIIANACDGDWDKASNPGWKPAAERWRDKYHLTLGGDDS